MALLFCKYVKIQNVNFIDLIDNKVCNCEKNAIGCIQTSLIIMDSQFDNIKLGAIISNGKSKIDIINCTFSNIPYTYAIFSIDRNLF